MMPKDIDKSKTEREKRLYCFKRDERGNGGKVIDYDTGEIYHWNTSNGCGACTDRQIRRNEPVLYFLALLSGLGLLKGRP